MLFKSVIKLCPKNGICFLLSHFPTTFFQLPFLGPWEDALFFGVTMKSRKCILWIFRSLCKLYCNKHLLIINLLRSTFSLPWTGSEISYLEDFRAFDSVVTLCDVGSLQIATGEGNLNSNGARTKQHKVYFLQYISHHKRPFGVSLQNEQCAVGGSESACNKYWSLFLAKFLEAPKKNSWNVLKLLLR